MATEEPGGAHMALHHRPEMSNMRFAYDQPNRRNTQPSSGSESNRSYGSQASSGERSDQTQATEASNRSKGGPHVHYPSDGRSPSDPPVRLFHDRLPQRSPSSSGLSESASDDETDDDDFRARDAPRPIKASSAIPADPSDFSVLFPSDRRLTIRHDDTTNDGNMNLRIDTGVLIHRRQRDMTLFHLRMLDLRNRDFSLRRYCRDSGREVCHSILKPDDRSASSRSSFHRSLNSALSNLKFRAAGSHERPRRFDSASIHSIDFDEDPPRKSLDGQSREQRPAMANVVRLDFSNYAHVDVRRRGHKSAHYYDFEYWGVNYTWRRRVDNALDDVSFYLTRSGSDMALAHIRPIPRSAAEAEHERQRGGWIAPCSMWIEDRGIIETQKDVADVVVASGLIALVDDAIRTRFGPEDTRKSLSRSSSGLADYIGAKQFMSGLFRRRSSTSYQEERTPNSRNSSRQQSGGGVWPFASP